ncbi:hypothetical protein VCBJG01_1974 [Vibrio cholerae BJG-01]|nr:hypothetical protein VCLMA_A1688 [Vibrio cholerae LMA3984-4]EGS68503.1 hypothetical protein VCBJG01_1974 [Vibrio cholerae BJG-01]
MNIISNRLSSTPLFEFPEIYSPLNNAETVPVSVTLGSSFVI